MAYKSTQLRSSAIVKKVITIHYFEYMSDFSFPGESHDFWEFVCVDKGVIDVMAGDKRIPLKKHHLPQARGVSQHPDQRNCCTQSGGGKL